MRKLVVWVYLLTAGFSCVSCKSLTSSKRSNAPAAPAVLPTASTLPVGTVHLVNQENQFILVRSSKFIRYEPGTALFTVSADGTTTAHLQLSEARKDSFLTADIVSGTPGQGERVLVNHEHRPPISPGEGTGASPLGGGNEIQILE